MHIDLTDSKVLWTLAFKGVLGFCAQIAVFALLTYAVMTHGEKVMAAIDGMESSFFDSCSQEDRAVVADLSLGDDLSVRSDKGGDLEVILVAHNDYVVEEKPSSLVDPINHLQLALNLSYHLESSFGKEIIGDNGRAIGPLQIQKVVVQDVNRILGYFAFTYDDRWDLTKSSEMFWVYLEHYGQDYAKKTGKKPTVETYLRIWNKGPNGYKLASSVHHWKKAQKVMHLHITEM